LGQVITWCWGQGPAAFEFVWRNVRWGRDRTRGNSEGNPPVILSPQFGNVEGIQASYSHLDEVNAVYTLGQGKGGAAEGAYGR
jgi:hypothetical protein